MLFTKLSPNRSVLCVDDEEGVLESYKEVLAPSEDLYSDILSSSEKGGEELLSATQDTKIDPYNLFLASSGEEAVKIVKAELEKGNRIAAGFFDMRMPGGIDGYETIKQVRELDPNVLCAVVTAFADRKVDQVRQLFSAEHQDEFLYFKKPFTTAELEQTTLNIVCSWNRKRNEEEYLRSIEKSRKVLKYILNATIDLSEIPAPSLRDMLSGILYQTLALLDSEDGYIAILEGEQKLRVGCVAGTKFKEEDLPRLMEYDKIKEVLAKGTISLDGNLCLVPLVFSSQRMGIIHLEFSQQPPDEVKLEILELFRTKTVPMIMSTIFYDEILDKSSTK